MNAALMVLRIITNLTHHVAHSSSGYFIRGKFVTRITPPLMGRRLPLRLAIALTTLGLGACAVTPQPVSLDEQVKQAAADRITMFADQEPVTAPISLEEAMARAVKYNLNQRLALMERALANNLTDVKSFSMLPKLAVSAGWNGRDRINASSSESILTGSQSLEPSTSQDRYSHTADMQLSWNVLDLGMGYYAAKAQGNSALALEEKRRRILADIIKQVRAAYWSAATEQRPQPEQQKTLQEARQALAQSRETERQRLVAPLKSLEYQKSLLTMVRQLEAVDAELASAKTKLAGLMNLPPATAYTLAIPSESALVVPNLGYQITDLEQIAMVKRPEIREEAYAARNAVLETKSDLMHLMPGASLFVGSNYNSNSYLVHDNWADAGIQVSWNLFNVLNYSNIKRSGEARAAVADLRRQALRMSVLTQLHLAWNQFAQAEQMFNRSAQLQDVQHRILQQQENSVLSRSGNLLERIKASTENVLATRMRDQTYAQMQTAYGAIYQAAGLDPLPTQLSDNSVAALSKAIAKQRMALAAGQMDVPNLYLLSRNDHNAYAANTTASMPIEMTIAQADMWNSLGSLQAISVEQLQN